MRAHEDSAMRLVRACRIINEAMIVRKHVSPIVLACAMIQRHRGRDFIPAWLQSIAIAGLVSAVYRHLRPRMIVRRIVRSALQDSLGSIFVGRLDTLLQTSPLRASNRTVTTGLDLGQLSLQGITLDARRVPGLSSGSYVGARLIAVTLKGGFSCATFEGCSIADCLLIDCRIDKSELVNAVISQPYATDFSLSNCDISGCKIRDATFIESSFCDLSGSGIHFENCVFIRCIFSKLSLRCVRVSECTFNDCMITESEINDVRYESQSLTLTGTASMVADITASLHRRRIGREVRPFANDVEEWSLGEESLELLYPMRERLMLILLSIFLPPGVVVLSKLPKRWLERDGLPDEFRDIIQTFLRQLNIFSDMKFTLTDYIAGVITAGERNDRSGWIMGSAHALLRILLEYVQDDDVKFKNDIFCFVLAHRELRCYSVSGTRQPPEIIMTTALGVAISRIAKIYVALAVNESANMPIVLETDWFHRRLEIDGVDEADQHLMLAYPWNVLGNKLAETMMAIFMAHEIGHMAAPTERIEIRATQRFDPATLLEYQCDVYGLNLVNQTPLGLGVGYPGLVESKLADAQLLSVAYALSVILMTPRDGDFAAAISRISITLNGVLGEENSAHFISRFDDRDDPLHVLFELASPPGACSGGG